MQLEVNFRLQAVFKLDDATNLFVSYCPALDIYSQGRTENEAKAAMRSAITLFVKYQYKRKKLDDLLNDRGFEPVEREAMESAVEFIEVLRKDYPHAFDVFVPLHLLAADEARRVSGVQ